MGNTLRISGVILLIILIHSCKKDKPTPPIVTTTDVTAITQSTATSGGEVTNEGGATVTARGVCWDISANPTTALSTKTTDGTGTGVFTSSITSLIPNTTYYVRAYATNSIGTGYGSDISFTLQILGILFNPNKTYGTITDVEGNVYKTIIIGTQTWMAENLETIKFKDGISIPLVTGNTEWGALTTPGYCWYDNNEAIYKATYGALYNWYTVNTGELCPTGWHVPSYAEWTTLDTYLGSESGSGGKLKETGTNHWFSPNSGGTNETGFTALPGGYRYDLGSFSSIGHYGVWWSATILDPNGARARGLYYNYSSVILFNYHKRTGFSVRCLKNN